MQIPAASHHSSPIDCNRVIDDLSQSVYAISQVNTNRAVLSATLNSGSLTEAVLPILDQKIKFCSNLQKISDDHVFVKPKLVGSPKEVRANTAAVIQHKENLKGFKNVLISSGSALDAFKDQNFKSSNKKLVDDWKRFQFSEISDILMSKKGYVKHSHEGEARPCDDLPSYDEAINSD